MVGRISIVLKVNNIYNHINKIALRYYMKKSSWTTDNKVTWYTSEEDINEKLASQLGERFVQYRKMFAAVNKFEIETEFAVHTSQLGVPFAEVPVNYGIRPEGSVSKLRTFADGFKILRAMVVLLKENRPLLMFGSLAAACFAPALVLAVPLAAAFVQTGLVPRLPTAVLATGLVVLSLLLVVSDLILDSAAKARIEVKRLAYLSQPSWINSTRGRCRAGASRAYS